MENQRTSGPPPWLQWIVAILGILGISVSDFLGFFPTDNQMLQFLVFAIVLFAVAALGTFSVKVQREQNQRLLDARNAELDASRQENTALNVQLAEQAEALRNKDSEIQKLKEEREVWKKILMTQTPSQAGYYMANRQWYEQFKTELVVSQCQVDVELVQNKGDPAARNLRFHWTLHLSNPSAAPISKIKFIYSGDGDITYPQSVTVNGDPARVSFDHFAEVTGDDCFMNIYYPLGLKKNGTAKVCIDYTLEKYIYNPAFDVIWFVPDALGFADVNQINICFLADGEVIKETTSALLRTYRLSGSYPQESDERIEYRTFENGRAGFAFTKEAEEDDLKQHGYRLILTNGENSLPGSSGDVPSRS